MKKRILSIILATLLIAAMAIPASATSISASRTWNSIIYHTNDTCNTGNYHCVIESDSVDCVLRTDVRGYNRSISENEDGMVYYDMGAESTLISTHSGTFTRNVTYMYAYHFLDGNQASLQKVYAN